MVAVTNPTELVGGGVERGVVDQRGQEDQQHQVGLELDPVLGGDQGHGDAGDHQQDGIGDPEAVGHSGDDHDADEQADAVGQADHAGRVPGITVPRTVPPDGRSGPPCSGSDRGGESVSHAGTSPVLAFCDSTGKP
jgi:hypothetical protein